MRLRAWAFLGGGVVLAAAATAACWAAVYFAPYYAVYGTWRAVRAGDAAELARRVDFPALQASVKADVVAAMRDRLSREPANPFGELGAFLGPRLADILVDRVASPDGLNSLLRRRVFTATDADLRSPVGKSVQAELRRVGPDRFVVALTPEGARAPVLLIYRRESLLDWRLAAVRLPF